MNFSAVKEIKILEGAVTKIASGAKTLWEKAGFKNLLPLATDTDRTTIYNGIGYKPGVRLSSSGKVTTSADMSASGFIPAKEGDILRIVGVTISSTTNCYVIAYNASNTKTGYLQIWKSQLAILNGDGMELTADTFGSGFNAIRFCFATIDENTIVTINEEIA